MLPYIIPDVSNLRQDRDYNSLLPDYEEAVLKQPPPPSYSVAVANGYAATMILPTTENAVSPSTSRHLETSPTTTPTMPPPAYSTLQRNSIISDIAEETHENSSASGESINTPSTAEPQSPISSQDASVNQESENPAQESQSNETDTTTNATTPDTQQNK